MPIKKFNNWLQRLSNGVGESKEIQTTTRTAQPTFIRSKEPGWWDEEEEEAAIDGQEPLKTIKGGKRREIHFRIKNVLIEIGVESNDARCRKLAQGRPLEYYDENVTSDW